MAGGGARMRQRNVEARKLQAPNRQHPMRECRSEKRRAGAGLQKNAAERRQERACVPARELSAERRVRVVKRRYAGTPGLVQAGCCLGPGRGSNGSKKGKNG